VRASQVSRLARLEDAKRRRDIDARLHWLRVQSEGALMLHAVLVQEGILRPPDPPMALELGGSLEDWSVEVPAGAPAASDDDMRVLFAGFLLSHARQAAPLFAVPESNVRLHALVREITTGRFVTLDEACSAAIEIGRRYGLVDEA
jgi:hypothetical protein